MRRTHQKWLKIIYNKYISTNYFNQRRRISIANLYFIIDFVAT